jgi:hypothetical protein
MGGIREWHNQTQPGEEDREVRTVMKYILGLVALFGPISGLIADDKPASPPSAPKITLYERHGHVTPQRVGFTHTGAGTMDVTQPTPDSLVVTMYGVAVAGAHPCVDSVASLEFDLNQCFEIAFDKPGGKKIKLSVEARVVGLLRSQAKGRGSADESSGCATIASGPTEIVSLCAPGHTVGCGENLSINDRDGPVIVPVTAGKYVLHQTFHLQASHPRSLLPCKAASAEFAPDPALDPLWISAWEPFHGASKKDFGLQVTIKVAPE